MEIQEAEQKKLESYGKFLRINEVVSLACSDFKEEGITLEMAPDSKIT